MSLEVVCRRSQRCHRFLSTFIELTMLTFLRTQTVRMAEWSKALRSGRSLHLQAWVRIPLLTGLFWFNIKHLMHAQLDFCHPLFVLNYPLSYQIGCHTNLSHDLHNFLCEMNEGEHDHNIMENHNSLKVIKINTKSNSPLKWIQ